MKKRLALAAVFGVFMIAVLFQACQSDPPTQSGILSITVISTQTGPVPIAHVFLATSYENLVNKNYYKDGWADSTGYVKFPDLPSQWYFYSAEGWDDYGATEVYLGTDHHVILFVNTPHIP
jgi:hypothetical protein